MKPAWLCPQCCRHSGCQPSCTQGLVQSFGVFVDTFFICSASAFIVLLSGNYQSGTLTGIELVQEDLSQLFWFSGSPYAGLLDFSVCVYIYYRQLLLWRN